MRTIYTLLLCAAFSVFLITCKSDDETNSKAEFDRTVFLENYANNIIKPNYTALLTRATELQAAVSSFSSQTDLAQLQALQNVWTSAYSQWMRTNSFSFGPASKQGLTRALREEIATFPPATSIIDSKISANNYELDDAQRASRGFLAIEYLIYGNGNNEETLAAFDDNRMGYLIGISDQIVERLTVINDAWTNGFTEEFIANDGTNVASSTTQMYNEWLRSFEIIRELKLIKPMGLEAGQPGPEPETAEAFYSKQSLFFMRQHFNSVVDLWHGRTADGSDGIGWVEYITELDRNDQLVDLTEAQIAIVEAAFDALPNDRTLEELVNEDNAELQNLQQELLNLVRFFRSDLNSLLCIAVTFDIVDGD
ncbi:MAG: imelysin family protein [Bacteroidota bacterium]